MAYVKLKLTEKEAAMLFVGANVYAEELRTEVARGDARSTAAFWRALEKLQAARQKFENAK